MTVATWASQAEVAEEAIVFVALGVWSGEQLFAHEDRVCSGEEAQRRGLARQRAPAGAQANHGSGHQNTRGGDCARKRQRIGGLRFAKRRAGDAHQHVDGHAFRVGIEARQLVQQADTVFVGFAHADDAAGADGDAGFSHRSDGAQAVFIEASRDDLTVKFR